MSPQTPEPTPHEGVPPWLASLILRRGGTIWPRFALAYHQLAAMPRRWRRQLRRKAAVGLGSAALILALAGPIVASPVLQPVAPSATITVINGEVADVTNGKCGLIEAIINARAKQPGPMRPDCTTGNVNGPDTVSLPNGGDFVLTESHNNQFGDTGLPVITSAVTIEGHGSTIRGPGVYPYFRILAVDASGHLILRNTTISHGVADAYGGGGVFSLGRLTISDSTITQNSVAVWQTGNGPGGGIYAAGPTTITNSAISDNSTWGGCCDDGPGGGIYIGWPAEATITGSTIIGNVSSGGYWSDGGGIFVGGTATIIDSVIAENINNGDETGGEGGGIYVGGQATISGSLIRDNVVYEFCEGYYNGECYHGTWPGYGGGLSNQGTTLIVNSTITSNTADLGGGLANVHLGELTVVESTVTGNDGRGIFSGEEYRMDNCSTTTLRGTIVSGNSGGSIFFEPTPDNSYHCYDDNYQPVEATFNVDAFNIFGNNSNAGLTGLSKGPTDIVPSVGLAAILSPLADNGGPTMTHALPAGSPALDRAPNASCTAAPVNSVDQRGQPRNQNGAGGASSNECDVGAFERGSGGGAPMGFYLSAAGSGSVGGVAFAPGDIIKFTPGGGWSMHFDASDVGITKNVSAFEIEDNGHILLSLAAAQNVPGAGAVAPHDVVRFTPTATGNNTAGSFAMALDGSANLLTTTSEKIDALGRTQNGRLALSTAGAAAVKRPDNTVLKAQDEDALGFNLSNSQWSAFFNGTTIPGLGVEDVNALWIDPATGDLYISIVGAFNLGGIAGNGRDIVKLSPSGAPGGYTPSLVWDGSAAGFPSTIDGLEMIP